MSDNGDGTWEVSLFVPPGEHEFIFLNGNSWDGQIEEIEGECGSGFGGRVAAFTALNDTYFACFNGCPGDSCEYVSHPLTILDLINADPELSLYASVLGNFGLDEDGLFNQNFPFTVFAFNNAAFEAAMEHLQMTPFEFAEYTFSEDFLLIVINHVTQGELPVDAFFDGLEPSLWSGEPIAISSINGEWMVNGSGIAVSDVLADNGVLHVLEQIPPSALGCPGGYLNDADSDGVCDEFEVLGCTDHEACNYEQTATDDDGSCVYASDFMDCNGECVNDLDGDGVCDELVGCTDMAACNFDYLHLYDIYNECVYDEGSGCEGETTFELDLSCIAVPEGARVFVRTTLTHPFDQMELVDSNGDFLYTGAYIHPAQAASMGMSGGASFAYYYEIVPRPNDCGWVYPASERDIAYMVKNHSGDTLFSCNFSSSSWSVADGRCGTIGEAHANVFGTEGTTCDDAQSEGYWFNPPLQLDMSNQENWNGRRFSSLQQAIGLKQTCFWKTHWTTVCWWRVFGFFPAGEGWGEYYYHDGSWDWPLGPGFNWASDCQWREFELTDEPVQILPVDCPTSCDGECASVGCSDPEACNFKATAENDDGSCIYNCCPGQGCCGAGTTWNSLEQVCEAIVSADLNLDGCVGMADLLDMLSAFGTCDSQ